MSEKLKIKEHCRFNIFFKENVDVMIQALTKCGYYVKTYNGEKGDIIVIAYTDRLKN